MTGSTRLDRPLITRSMLALAAVALLFGVLASRADAGAWGTPFDLSATSQRAERVRVGADAAGDQFAVWQHAENSEYVVQAATRPAGGSWSAPVDLSVPAGREDESLARGRTPPAKRWSPGRSRSARTT